MSLIQKSLLTAEKQKSIQ